MRASENLLSLTQTLKEAWLFGKLHTVGISEAEDRAEEAARKVMELLGRAQSIAENSQVASGKREKAEKWEVAIESKAENEGS